MPSGYLVTLGDGILDPGDAITDPLVTFTTDTVIGAGDWVWSGTFGGTTFTNESEPGVYYLATDGQVYFVPDFGPVTTITSASVETAPAYDEAIYGTAGDDALISGTGGDDLIYGGADRTATGTGADTISAGSGNDSVFAGDGNDSVLGGDGDDTLDGQGGADTLIGGQGADSLIGGDGDDVLDGGGGTPVVSTSESLNWSTQGGDESSVAGGFTQNTGTMSIGVTIRNDGNMTGATIESSTIQYTGSGEPFDNRSALEISGSGLGATATAILDFSANSGSGMTDEVENVSFRINDIDTGGWQDQVTILAYDADGNAVPVVLTASGNDTVTGDTVVAGPGGESASSPNGSVLIEIAGPVSRIEIEYSNLDTAGQIFFVTDVHFDTIPELDGPDTLEGGLGDDTLTLGDLDLGLGGDGDDLFLIDAAELNGGTITVIGGEGDETDGDTLDLTGILEKGSIVYTNTDDNAGGLSGTATLTDGTVVTFSEIETIICFTEGTAIQTPHGERRIESLRQGDLVLTLDHGPQPIRWIGRKTVRATGNLAPIRFAKGSVGNHRDLLVSPQHRMLCGGYLSQLHFGEPEVLAPAKSLVDNFGVTIAYGGMVTYVHMLFDQHEVVIANGAPSESFFPGANGLDTLSAASRDELFNIFPELRSNVGSYGPVSRVCVKPSEARALVMN